MLLRIKNKKKCLSQKEAGCVCSLCSSVCGLREGVQRVAQFEETDFAGAPLGGRFSAITRVSKHARAREQGDERASFIFPPPSRLTRDSHSNQRARAEHMWKQGASRVDLHIEHHRGQRKHLQSARLWKKWPCYDNRLKIRECCFNVITTALLNC